MNKPSNWVRTRTFKQMYDLSDTMLYRYIHAKEFPSKKVGKSSWRIDVSRVDEWFKRFDCN